MINRGCLSH
uniref:Uncharacterized protein n=1 Tax=Anguilla anguilla TaxID=7936 RepID=A0A0E9PVA3_ANGAN